MSPLCICVCGGRWFCTIANVWVGSRVIPSVHVWMGRSVVTYVHLWVGRRFSTISSVWVVSRVVPSVHMWVVWWAITTLQECVRKGRYHCACVGDLKVIHYHCKCMVGTPWCPLVITPYARNGQVFITTVSITIGPSLLEL